MKKKKNIHDSTRVKFFSLYIHFNQCIFEKNIISLEFNTSIAQVYFHENKSGPATIDFFSDGATNSPQPRFLGSA